MTPLATQTREAEHWAKCAREVDRHCVNREPYRGFLVETIGGGRLRFVRPSGPVDVQVSFERGWLKRAWLEAKAEMDRAIELPSPDPQ